MTFILAKNIAYFFYKKNIIPKDKLEEYTFGFEILLADISILSIIGILSVCADKIIESVIFLLAFILLRRQTGGYHANSHLNCNIIFISTYLIFLILIFCLPDEMKPIFSVCELLVSDAVILLLAPVEHPNSPASPAKHKRCRKKSIVILFVENIMSIALIFINKSLAVSLATGIFTVSVYILAQCIKNCICRKCLKERSE